MSYWSGFLLRNHLLYLVRLIGCYFSIKLIYSEKATKFDEIAHFFFVCTIFFLIQLYLFSVKSYSGAKKSAQCCTWMSVFGGYQKKGRLCISNRPCHRNSDQIVFGSSKCHGETSPCQYCYRIWGQFRCWQCYIQFQKNKSPTTPWFHPNDPNFNDIIW